MNNKIAWIALVVAIAVGIFVIVRTTPAKFPTDLGAAGGLLAENYIPYIMYNDGYKSAKAIDTTSTLDVDGVSTLAATAITGATTLTGSFTVGSAGDAADRINHGFCNANAAATTITASSTALIDCGSGSNGLTALTGVAAGDVCFLSQATTTSSANEGLIISGASASTTQGFITARVTNQTGTTFTWTAAASTSLPYMCIDS